MTGNSCRQYMPNKLHKWGIKLFALCDTNGFMYNFEIFFGTLHNILLPNTPDLKAVSYVVVQLSQKNVNHVVYFDNYYTTSELLVFMRSQGIYCRG